ncbi:antitoxin MazE7 [Streptomyces sp. NPDC088387]|uniref:antitoxin MazE7 n=1 Tax=Streptomyces sp. NPDC088387 TaxID=3365859 RepID=UPI0037F565D9
MADTSVKIDEETRDRLKALAESSHMSMKEYLAELAVREENARRLETATAVFRRATGEPGIREAFDAEFGGLPAAASGTRRAA